VVRPRRIWHPTKHGFLLAGLFRPEINVGSHSRSQGVGGSDPRWGACWAPACGREGVSLPRPVPPSAPAARLRAGLEGRTLRKSMTCRHARTAAEVRTEVRRATRFLNWTSHSHVLGIRYGQRGRRRIRARVSGGERSRKPPPGSTWMGRAGRHMGAGHAARRTVSAAINAASAATARFRLQAAKQPGRAV
jgi:hypothetical protein